MRATRSLLIAAPVIAGLSVVGALVSILARWPHQFAGHGDRQHMLADFASSGTALAPPLAFLILFSASSLLIRRRDRWGTIACVVLIALSALMVVGSLGEASAGRTADVPRAVQVFSGVGHHRGRAPCISRHQIDDHGLAQPPIRRCRPQHHEAVFTANGGIAGNGEPDMTRHTSTVAPQSSTTDLSPVR